ncbi:hypothetical protein Tco_1360922 [Tanacetum coccineum]
MIKPSLGLSGSSGTRWMKMVWLSGTKQGPDESGVSVNETQFGGMIRSLMYLIASRPDIQFSTCLCARYQADPKESHLAYSDSDYAGCNLDRKSTSGGCQILREKLVCWSAKKQNSMAMSSAKTEYVVAARCCAQVLWIKSQLADYDILYDKYKILLTNLEGSNAAYSQVPGRKSYKNDKLKTFKPHHFSATSFKTLLANEVALIPHMLKVPNISIKPEQNLILPTKEVNVGNTIDKSLSETTVHPISQPKASTDQKLRKKKISSSSKPKTSKNVRQSKPKKTVVDTQHVEESVATVDATKSLEASKSVEELRNQPKTADAEKLRRLLAIDSRIKSFGNVNLDDLLKDQEVNEEAKESPFEIEFEIKFIGKADQEMEEADSDLESMPNNEIMSVLGNDNEDDDFEELSMADEIVADKLVNLANTWDADTLVFVASSLQKKKNIPRVKILNVQTLGAIRRFKEIQITKAPGSDPIGHLARRLDFLSAQVNNVAKNLPIELNKNFASTASTVPFIVSDAITQQLPDLLTATLKDTLPQPFTNAVRDTLPGFN